MKRTGARMLAIGLLAAGVASCGDESDEAQSESGPTCEEVGAHLGDLCAPSFGREAELDCEIFGLTLRTRQCVMRLDDCSGSLLTGCELSHPIVPCTMDAECPSPLLCDESREQCAECAEDTDCSPENECRSGVCVPPDL